MTRKKIDFAHPILPGFEEFFSTDSNQANMTPPAQKRSQAYLWVTWLAELLAGEKRCSFSVWKRTHYQLPKPPSSYDSSQHDEMVIQRAAQLQAEGFIVYVEYANAFKFKGKIFDICVAGRPDIVAIKDGWVVVEDIKTGRRKDSHKLQVLLYMLLLPFAPETQQYCNGQTPHGRLIYPDRTVEIPASSVDRPFKERLRQSIAAIASPTPPNPNPTSWECRYCKVPGAYCPSKLSVNGDFAA